MIFSPTVAQFLFCLFSRSASSSFAFCLRIWFFFLSHAYPFFPIFGNALPAMRFRLCRIMSPRSVTPPESGRSLVAAPELLFTAEELVEALSRRVFLSVSESDGKSDPVVLLPGTV